MAKYGLSEVYYGNQSISELLRSKIINYSLLEYPNTNTNTSRIAMAHKSATTRHFISRNIVVQFAIEASDMIGLESDMARLRMISQARWKELTIEAGILTLDNNDWIYGSDDITWENVRIDSFEIDQVGKAAVVTVTFVADNPIGFTKVPQQLFSDSGVTASSKTFDLSTIELQGTFYLQYPTYELVINSSTPSATPQFIISNGFAKMQYNGILASGDQYHINCKDTLAFINGVPVDYDGALPVIDRDSTHELKIEHNYTSINYDILITNQSGYF